MRIVPLVSVLAMHAATSTMAAPEDWQLPQISPNGDTFVETQCFDNLITTFMRDNRIPGIGTAVMKDGKIVYAQGYGMKDHLQNKAFMHTPFRIASVSKPVTALTIMRLIQSGQLLLGNKVFGRGGVLQDFPVNPDPERPIVDLRLFDITIEQLLSHTAGWDGGWYDPMFQSIGISSALRISGPATCRDTVYYMLSEELNSTPGEKYAYSNFGYCILGLVVERLTGTSYEQAVRDLLLDRAGVRQEEMYLGSTLQYDIPEKEAEYFCPGCVQAPSVFPPHDPVPWPYGVFSLEAMDAHGRWVASAVQLMKMMSFVHEPHCARNDPPFTCLIWPESFANIVKKGQIYDEADANWWYGLGFNVKKTEGGFNLWHDGSLPGTSTLLVFTNEAYGYSWAILANRRGFDGNIDDLMWNAVACVQDSWPASFRVTSSGQVAPASEGLAPLEQM